MQPQWSQAYQIGILPAAYHFILLRMLRVIIWTQLKFGMVYGGHHITF